MPEIEVGRVSAPPGASEILKGKVWWTSVWPLFAVSVVVSLIVQEAGGPKGLVGVGGVGALIVGSALARSFVKNPVFTYGAAFNKGAWTVGSLVLLFSLVLTAPMLYADFERQGMEHPGRAVAFGVFVEVLVSTLMLSATWAFFITRKAKKVMRAAGFPLVEEVTANAPRSDLELFVKGPVQESEGAITSAPAAPALFAPTKPAKRSKMRALLDTGWGRLFIVAWVAWAGWRLYEVNRLVERRYDGWEPEPIMNLVMTGLVFPLVAVLVVLWVARGFKKTVG